MVFEESKVTYDFGTSVAKFQELGTFIILIKRQIETELFHFQNDPDFLNLEISA